MKAIRLFVLFILAGGCLAAAMAAPAAAADAGQIAPLLEGMGVRTVPVTTDDPMAQKFFDQGLMLAYGFNHAEADRSFREAARRDPDCAMCWWGAALVLGPNVNDSMHDENVPRAWDALQKARAAAPQASARERAYIEALSARYAENPPADRTALDEAYADAMRKLTRKFPDDMDAAALTAEALMDLHPWDFWLKNGEAQPWTAEVTTILETVLEREPDHPGAIHFYIHAVEASKQPERAEAGADRLVRLVPGAGHLVHMPSHIYIRVGRYGDAVDANRRAVLSDDEYVTQCHAQGIYPLAYMPHNHHFLWAAASFAGDSGAALASAQATADLVEKDKLGQPEYSFLEHYWVTPYYAMVRFGRWEEILEMPAPPADLAYPTAVWRYARALALANRDRLDEADRELATLNELLASPQLTTQTDWEANSRGAVVNIGAAVVAGEIAARRGQYDKAIRNLEHGVELEDGLAYIEPPDWHLPVRLNLGAILLEAEQPAAAEAVYRRDLEEHPHNGWALFGLAKSLKKLGKTDAARQVEAEYRQAWTRSDIELTASRF